MKPHHAFGGIVALLWFLVADASPWIMSVVLCLTLFTASMLLDMETARARRRLLIAMICGIQAGAIALMLAESAALVRALTGVTLLYVVYSVIHIIIRYPTQ